MAPILVLGFTWMDLEIVMSKITKRKHAEEYAEDFMFSETKGLRPNCYYPKQMSK